MDKQSTLDRRIVRTRVAIRQAFIDLVEDKGFDSLQVSDVARRADINRGTFYLHYQDKFDLLEQTRAEIVSDLESIILAANSLNLADFNSVDKPLPVVVTLFEYLKANRALMHAFFSIEGGVVFQAQIRSTMEKNLKLGFLAALRVENFLVPADYLIHYAISAHFGVIQTWLDRGCVESPHEMALILSKLSWLGLIRCSGFKLPSD